MTEQTYRALLIKDGAITPIDLRTHGSGAMHTHELIGDTFCQCFAVRTGHNRRVVGYCDDNFLQKDLPLNVILTSDLYDWVPPGYAIDGPIVITANDGPDTVDMTEDERERFYTVGPLLRYRPNGK